MDDQNREPKIVHRKRPRRAAGTSGQKAVLRSEGAGKPGLLRFTMVFLYKNLYILGITLLRLNLRNRRRMRKFFARMRGGMYHQAHHTRLSLVRFGKGVINRIKGPFVRLGTVRSQMRPVIAEKRRDGKIPLRAYGQIVFTFLKLVYTILRTIFNYSVSVAAAVLLVNLIGGRLSQPIGLEVYYNDQIIGFIETEADFEAAARELKSRYISSDTTALLSTPRFVLREAENGETYTPRKELTDRILAVSQDKIGIAYGFYVDDVFYGAVDDSKPLLAELDAILAENSIGLEGEQLSFAKRVRLAPPSVYPLSSIIELKDIRDHIRSYETQEEVYTVAYGDSISLISSKTGVPSATLIALNPEIEDGLKPDQELVLYRARPFMSVKNTYTAVYEEDVPYETEEIETSTYVKGYRMPSVTGQPGLQQVTAEISTVNGEEIERTVLDRVLLRAPVNEKVIVGTNDPRSIVASAGPAGGGSAVSSSGWLWPTVGGYIGTSLGGYVGHTGVDIPRPSGTPIFASAAGTVVKAVKGRVSYGQYVVIDHGNGYTTLYAHASALHVTVGQRVNQGDVIASVGRTGNATGNHLHFEVRLNGRVMNPRNYIG